MSIEGKNSFKIILPYSKEAKEQLRTKESNLYIFYLDEGKKEWQLIANREVDKEKMTVSARVNKFGTYTIIEVYSIGTDIGHHPTPTKYPDVTKITFVNIPSGEEIKIYNRVGELVRTVKEQAHEVTGNEGERLWNLRNDSGNIVSSDVYFYVVRKKDGKPHIGKMMVIK